MSSSELVATNQQLYVTTIREDSRVGPAFIAGPRATQLVIGHRELRSHLWEILELRRRCDQQDDFTTEPEYFIAANTFPNRRCAAVLIRHDHQLEACVLFYEHTRFSIGLGLFRGGDYIGESLVVGDPSLRVQYVHLATQALLKQWRAHGVSLTFKASSACCMEVMGAAITSGDFAKQRCSTRCHWKAPTRGCWPGWDPALGVAWQASVNNWKKARTFNSSPGSSLTSPCKSCWSCKESRCRRV